MSLTAAGFILKRITGPVNDDAERELFQAIDHAIIGAPRR
jgi:hypothetical protein